MPESHVHPQDTTHATMAGSNDYSRAYLRALSTLADRVGKEEDGITASMRYALALLHLSAYTKGVLGVQPTAYPTPSHGTAPFADGGLGVAMQGRPCVAFAGNLPRFRGMSINEDWVPTELCAGHPIAEAVFVACKGALLGLSLCVTQWNKLYPLTCPLTHAFSKSSILQDASEVDSVLLLATRAASVAVSIFRVANLTHDDDRLVAQYRTARRLHSPASNIDENARHAAQALSALVFVVSEWVSNLAQAIVVVHAAWSKTSLAVASMATSQSPLLAIHTRVPSTFVRATVKLATVWQRTEHAVARVHASHSQILAAYPAITYIIDGMHKWAMECMSAHYRMAAMWLGTWCFDREARYCLRCSEETPERSDAERAKMKHHPSPHEMGLAPQVYQDLKKMNPHAFARSEGSAVPGRLGGRPGALAALTSSAGAKNGAGVWIPSGRLPCIVHLALCDKLERRGITADANNATAVPYLNVGDGPEMYRTTFEMQLEPITQFNALSIAMGTSACMRTSLVVPDVHARVVSELSRKGTLQLACAQLKV